MYEKELTELSRAGARYLVIGGVALGLHGYLRATVDLDLLPDLKSENLGIIADTLGSLGYVPRVPVDPRELKDPRKRQYWHSEKNMEVFTFVNHKNYEDSIDIMIYPPLDFEQCYQRKHIVHIKDEEVTVASVEDLMTLKRMSMRAQDRADLEVLQRLLERKNER